MEVRTQPPCTDATSTEGCRRRRPLSIRRIRMCARTAGAGRRKSAPEGRGTTASNLSAKAPRRRLFMRKALRVTPRRLTSPACAQIAADSLAAAGILFLRSYPAAASLFSVQPPDGPVATCARRGLGSPRRAFFWVFHVRVTPRRQAAKVFQPDEPSNMGGARKRKSITTAQPVRCRRLCGLAARRETEMATLIAFCTEDTA